MTRFERKAVFERKVVIMELAILSATLIVTSLTGLGVYIQASKHFALQRTSYMIERFNEHQLVENRYVTDKWLDTNDAPKALFDRAEQGADPEKAKEASETIKRILVFCNFFQELGTAEKRHTLDEGYMWDVFGGIIRKYGEELRPFVEELRARRQRQTLLQEFTALTEKMRKLDEKYLRG